MLACGVRQIEQLIGFLPNESQPICNPLAHVKKRFSKNAESFF